MFQVRHLYEHNLGVIDEDFIQKIPRQSENIGRKYILQETEIEKFIMTIKELGGIMKEHFNKQEII